MMINIDIEELKYDNKLSKDNSLMSELIKQNPKAILYLQDGSIIDDNIIINALKEYNVTEEDLWMHPNLTKCSSLMKHLPRFITYSKDCPREIKKQELICSLILGASIHRMPFFQYRFNSEIDSYTADAIIKNLNFEVSDDVLKQKEYLNTLNDIVGSIARLRYKKNKPFFKFGSVAALTSHIFNSFLEKESYAIEELSYEIKEFTNDTIDTEYLNKSLTLFYMSFLSNGKNHIGNASEFANRVLNLHRNYYIKNETNEIMNEIKEKLTLTRSKKNALMNRKKLALIEEYIKHDKYDKLTVNKDKLSEMIDSLYSKDIKKSIKKEDFDKIKDEFLESGKITQDNLLKMYDKDMTKHVINAFNRLKLSIFDGYKFTPSDYKYLSDEKMKLSVNEQNYIIGSKDRLLDTIASLTLEIKNNNVEDFMKNLNNFNDNNLLLFVGLISEFDLNAMFNIILYYDEITDKIAKENDGANRLICKNFNRVLELASTYTKSNIASKNVLGSYVSSLIDSVNLEDYKDFYIEARKKKYSSIPNIDLWLDKMHFVSGEFMNEERLIIGRKFKGSCLDLTNPAGRNTFKELMLSTDADVILVKDENGELINRIMAFRRGNTIQLVGSYALNQMDYKIYKYIAEYMLSISNMRKDNLDYIFINMAALRLQDYNIGANLNDRRFITEFPHADLSNTAKLLAYNPNQKINFRTNPLRSYEGRRRINYEGSLEDVKKINTLGYFLTGKYENKKMDKINKIVVGEDWYLLYDGSSFYEYILPNSPLALKEMEDAKEIINSKKLIK